MRMYRPAGRPQAVSLDRNADDTETETEVENSGALYHRSRSVNVH